MPNSRGADEEMRPSFQPSGIFTAETTERGERLNLGKGCGLVMELERERTTKATYTRPTRSGRPQSGQDAEMIVVDKEDK